MATITTPDDRVPTVWKLTELGQFLMKSSSITVAWQRMPVRSKGITHMDSLLFCHTWSRTMEAQALYGELESPNIGTWLKSFVAVRSIISNIDVVFYLCSHWTEYLLTYWLTDLLTYWRTYFSLTDWLTDLLTDWLTDLLTDWLTYLLTYLFLIYLLTDWLTYLLTDVLISYLLTDWLTYLLTDVLISHLLSYWLTYLLTYLLTYWRTYFLLTYWLTYLVTYLVTYSIEQSPSWEAKWFSPSQEIPYILWNPNVHYRIHKCPPPVPILSQLDPVHTPTSYFLKIHLNIILPSTPWSPKWYNEQNNIKKDLHKIKALYWCISSQSLSNIYFRWFL